MPYPIRLTPVMPEGFVPRTLEPIKCRRCPVMFTPFRSTDKDCSPACRKLSRKITHEQLKAKAQRQKERNAKDTAR